MVSNFINTKYHPKLIETMVRVTKNGTLISNIVAPLLTLYVVWEYMSHFVILIWFGINVLFYILRYIIGEKILKILYTQNDLVYVYLKQIYFLSFSSALLFGLLIWYGVLISMPSLSIFILAIVIFALTAGSIATLGSVFVAYFVYVVTNFVMLITALLYNGGEEFILFGITMSVLLVILVTAGYKHHILIRNALSLDETFKIIYDNSSDGLMISKNGRFISCNRAILDMFHLDSEKEFLETNVSAYSPKYQPNGERSFIRMARMAKTAQEEGSVSFEWLHKKSDGEEFWCDVVLTKIYLDGEELLYGSWRDITDRKEIQLSETLHKQEIEAWNANLESLVQAEVEKNMLKDRQMLHQSRLAQMGEMISMIAHQWRQPLSAISAASALLNLKSQLNKLDKETAGNISKDISNYAQYLSATIDDFRDFFQRDKNKEATNYTYLVKSVLSIIENSLHSHHIEIKEELLSFNSFMAYKNELKQVIINIMKNSQDVLLERKIENPYILLKSYQSEDAYVLEISDNGGGINEELFEKIFDPYYSTKRQKDGTGLGLYMSKIIVEEHCGGKLSCCNMPDGLCCKMEIPIA